jgi:hypothetical protein
MAIVKDGVIKVWFGIGRGNREYLIFRRMETIEQHARELLDLLDSEGPQEDSAGRQVLLLDLLVEIEDRQDHWDADDAEWSTSPTLTKFKGQAGDRVLPAALAGKAGTVLGDPDQPHAYTYMPNIGEGLAVLGEHPEALGQVWHLPSDPNTDTTRQLSILSLSWQACRVPDCVRSNRCWSASPRWALRSASGRRASARLGRCRGWQFVFGGTSL